MSLSREQYESIMLQYSQSRARHRRILEAHRRRVFALIPAYRELDESVSSLAVNTLRERLGGEGSSDSSLRPALLKIAARKRELLRKNGFPEDYLEMQYDCPDCRDTGMIGSEKCHCFKKREIELLFDQSHLGVLVSEAGFDKLSEAYYQGEDLRRFRNARDASLRFVSEFGTGYGNLYFYGTVGTGKSFLSACIAGEIMKKGFSVLYYSAAALFEKMASLSFDYRSRDKALSLAEDLYTCDLLIIDDLGTELTNQFVSAQLFTCLTERHLNRKSTIISTNLSLEEMQRRYSDRLFSRIASSYTICKLTGKDIRILKRRNQAQHHRREPLSERHYQASEEITGNGIHEKT